MPSISSTPPTEASTSQLDSNLRSFTTLTDPLTISVGLLVFTNALQAWVPLPHNVPQTKRRHFCIPDPATHAATAQKILSSVPLTHLFQLLQQDFGYDTEAVMDMTCTLIEALLEGQSYAALTQDPAMVQALEQALQSPSPRVHALGCSQVDKVAIWTMSGPDYETLLPFYHTNVFKLLLQGLTSKDSIAIAERTKQSLIKVIASPHALVEALQDDENNDKVHEMVNNSRNAIVQLRTLEVLIEITADSINGLQALEGMQMLDALKSGLDSSDVLTRFNIIELLGKFGTKAGTDFLDEMGIFTRLADIVANDTDKDSLSVNAVVKLYGQLGSAMFVPYHTIDMKYHILAQLERIITGGDEEYHVSESLKQEAIAAVGLTGGNGNNLQLLLDSSCGETFTKMYASLGRDSKVVWFHALAQILQGGGGVISEGRDVRDFYERLEAGQSAFVGRLFTAAKSQSVELALAALSAMINLAHFGFGVQKIGQDREAINFLLDRNVDLTHAGKVARAEVISNMLDTVARRKSESGELLTADQISRLDLVRRQGAFYQRATATVAIQDITA
ncbi:26S proteasome non-ATPase regulatory subunit 5 [Podila clonocystis]|nr:26S proteasome non-ATPase regulatory subunit 5 [Podila clonocystis]